MKYMRMKDDPLNDLIKDWLFGKKDLTGIEIGSYNGESTDMFIRSNAFFRLYCIDPWRSGYDPNDIASEKDILTAEKIFNMRFKNNLHVIKIRQSSDESVRMFDDLSIDFIYIDGNHQYEFVKRDILNYFPKVKYGGIIAGHDFDSKEPQFAGVTKAVLEVFRTPPLRIYKEHSWVYIKI